MVMLAGSGQTSIGVEAIQTNALVQIFENLEGQLRRQAAAWDPIDRSLADKLQQPYQPTKLEFPPKGSYYPGGRLGILGMPWDAFPAVSVMADRFDPATSNASIDGYGADTVVSLYIEAIVRSDTFESGDPDPTPAQRAFRVFQEGLVDRRAKRTLEALAQCIAIDRTIGGLLPELPTPSGGQTDPFTLGGSEPGNMNLKRVFSLIRINYTPSVTAIWPDAASPAPPVLPSGFGS